jgi:T6SS, Phospholipase effector Tle1-like, catalytic domain
MPKNIVIFSDGTGQAGGINFDEARTNVYKLFRACRVGPDTRINPSDQVAFYDPGLGSAADGGHFKVGWLRWAYNLASMATGLGITANIIDCYAAIIHLYEDGDRIFLIGFSRGAYTVRSLAGVMSYCGIPRHLPGGAPLRLDLKGSHQLAEHAVKDVYQFCSSYDPKTATPYLQFMMRTRDAIAAKFRADYGCSAIKDGTEQANVFPYFIGVFDTVAALGNKWLAPVLIAIVLAVPFGLYFLGNWLEPAFPWAGGIARDFGYLSVFAAPVIYLMNYLKIAPRLPDYGFFKRLATLHLTRPKHQFYDTTLNVNVGYAKHAISIDENRADFARVKWSPTAEKLNKRDEHENLYFEQVWFPGVHADVGGGYLENEARLSDNALGWMVAAASIIPDGLKHDGSVLQLWPDAEGPQHDEQVGGWLKKGLRNLPVDDKTHESRATMHKSVYRRFAGDPVLLFDKVAPYRPPNMGTHVDFKQYFGADATNKPADDPQCVADDIEAKWREACCIGRL